MLQRAKLLVALSALASIAIWPAVARARVQANCTTKSVGIDTSRVTDTGELIWGMAWGQTFTATDTLIQSVTVWQMAPEYNDSTSTKFWITEVDSGGTPHTHLVTYEGPWLFVVSPDSTRPTPITYVFNPPIALPRPSVYCFWIQVCTGYADLLIDRNNDCTQGMLWETFRSDFDGCILRDYPQSFGS